MSRSLSRDRRGDVGHSASRSTSRDGSPPFVIRSIEAVGNPVATARALREAVKATTQKILSSSSESEVPKTYPIEYDPFHPKLNPITPADLYRTLSTDIEPKNSSNAAGRSKSKPAEHSQLDNPPYPGDDGLKMPIPGSSSQNYNTPLLQSFDSGSTASQARSRGRSAGASRGNPLQQRFGSSLGLPSSNRHRSNSNSELSSARPFGYSDGAATSRGRTASGDAYLGVPRDHRQQGSDLPPGVDLNSLSGDFSRPPAVTTRSNESRAPSAYRGSQNQGSNERTENFSSPLPRSTSQSPAHSSSSITSAGDRGRRARQSDGPRRLDSREFRPSKELSVNRSQSPLPNVKHGHENRISRSRSSSPAVGPDVRIPASREASSSRARAVSSSSNTRRTNPTDPDEPNWELLEFIVRKHDEYKIENIDKAIIWLYNRHSTQVGQASTDNIFDSSYISSPLTGDLKLKFSDLQAFTPAVWFQPVLAKLQNRDTQEEFEKGQYKKLRQLLVNRNLATKIDAALEFCRERRRFWYDNLYPTVHAMRITKDYKADAAYYTAVIKAHHELTGLDRDASWYVLKLDLQESVGRWMNRREEQVWTTRDLEIVLVIVYDDAERDIEPHLRSLGP